MGYLIFARREYERPLEWIGQLQGETAGAGHRDRATESVQRQALERFGEVEWVEMVAVPEGALVRVIPLE